MEWWYVSGYLPEPKLAFHWAQFKVAPPRGCISSGWDGVGRITNGVKRNEWHAMIPISA